jgi:hypothetical protein
LGGVAGGIVGLFPSFALSVVFCEVVFDGLDADCLESITYAGTALSVTIGAGLGVMAAGYLLDGKARTGATLGGAVISSAIGVTIGLFHGMDLLDMAPFLLVGPAVGATLVYAFSDAFFPDPSRRIAPARKEEVDEYARVLPMVSTTRTGGVIAGLVGRF